MFKLELDTNSNALREPTKEELGKLGKLAREALFISTRSKVCYILEGIARDIKNSKENSGILQGHNGETIGKWSLI